MLISNFDYSLPQEFIAQQPAEKRDLSRLMLVRRDSESWAHRRFRELPSLLRPGDLLVVNDSRVRPRRLITRREGTQGRVEVLLLEEVKKKLWTALLRPTKHLKVGDVLDIVGETGYFKVSYKGEYGFCRLDCSFTREVETLCDKWGITPLPPYIKRKDPRPEDRDRERYQTLFARYDGSVAAPTAGLHFTEEVLGKLESTGVDIVRLTLHVGLATFLPVRVTRVEKHKVPPEKYVIGRDAADRIMRAKTDGRRIIAVGTTTVRVLESIAGKNNGVVAAGSGLAEIFIYPPFQFKIVDALLTNFHLPRSSLLVLVAAFSGRELLLKCYEEAVIERYQFYSYGDCMLIF